MNDQLHNWVRHAPGKPVLKGVNWGGLKTLYIKEVRRFFKVQMQTVWAPAITTLLYLVIFTVALGRSGRMIMGVPFADFLAPGLIVMAMIQNAFANSSFSLLVGKIQGNIVDYLMPPLSTGELIAGLIGASVTRAFLVGFAVWLAMLLWPGVSVDIRRPELVLWFGLMGALLLSFLGLLTSVWAEKFDHAAAVSNFVVTPLSLRQRHLLFGPPAVADLPGGEPRQPLLLHHLGLPRGVPRHQQFAACGSARSALLARQRRCCGRPATRCLKSGWKIKN